ncbi:hypothetical protein CerSpe_158500 [Prunus speciosa]
MAAVLLISSNPNPLANKMSRSNPSRPSRTTMAIMSQDQPYWASVHAEIEVHLKQHILVRPPLSVFESMHHFVFSAPPSPAPALCVAACELVGGHRDQAIAAAAALHLMHAAAVIHEQLPSTDRPKTKPKPGPMAYSPGIELLTGDGIFAFGYELLAKSMDPAQNNSERVLRVIVEMTRAMGSQGMVDGQYHEILLLCKQSRDYNYVCEKKEGGFHACGAACGAILGGASEEEIERLRRYGLCVGAMRAFSNRVEEGNEMETKEVVKELRSLALKELEFFHEGKAEAISSFLHVLSL